MGRFFGDAAIVLVSGFILFVATIGRLVRIVDSVFLSGRFPASYGVVALIVALFLYFLIPSLILDLVRRKRSQQATRGPLVALFIGVALLIAFLVAAGSAFHD